MTTATDVLPMVMRADWVPGPPQGCWTYADYAAIPDDGNRYEILEGVLYMSPAPSLAHQVAAGRIFAFLMIHIDFAGRGRVLIAPTDVELPGKRDLVQPDIVVVLNAHFHLLTPSR